MANNVLNLILNAIDTVYFSYRQWLGRPLIEKGKIMGKKIFQKPERDQRSLSVDVLNYLQCS